MKILSLLNTVFIPVIRNEKKYYMLLDSGCPLSISNHINLIEAADLGLDTDFYHTFNKHDFESVMKFLSQLVGIEVVGILGLDFISSFDNLLINVREQFLDFNVSNFEEDFELNCQFSQFITTRISPVKPENSGLTVFDTGAFQCMAFKSDFVNYPVSKSWLYVSFMGQMIMDYYNDVELYLNNHFMGKHIFGVASNLPNLPFDCILGMNFISQYELLIDKANSKLRFKKSQSLPLINLLPTHSPGFQIIIDNNNIVVSHVRENCPNKVNMGDIINIEGIDMTQDNKVNSIYNTLVFRADKAPLNVKINEEYRKLVMSALFE